MMLNVSRHFGSRTKQQQFRVMLQPRHLHILKNKVILISNHTTHHYRDSKSASQALVVNLYSIKMWFPVFQEACVVTRVRDHCFGLRAVVLLINRCPAMGANKLIPSGAWLSQFCIFKEILISFYISHQEFRIVPKLSCGDSCEIRMWSNSLSRQYVTKSLMVPTKLLTKRSLVACFLDQVELSEGWLHPLDK